MMFNGMVIIEDRNMTDTVEDWSEVRSRSRAERRRRCGHKQRIVYRHVPKPDVYRIGNRLVMHPEKAKALRDSLASYPSPSVHGESQ